MRIITTRLVKLIILYNISPTPVKTHLPLPPTLPSGVVELLREIPHLDGYTEFEMGEFNK